MKREKAKFSKSAKNAEKRENLTRRYNKPVNNCDIMESLLDSWIANNVNADDNQQHNAMPSTYTKAKMSQVNEPFFVTTKSSVEK